MQEKGMVRTFLSLKGNPRACIWTEPLWGIPYNLVIPYASLYMEALGLSKVEIGALASIALFVQIFGSVASGALADKLGRRLCTLIFDCLCWSLPCLLWMGAQNYAWFLAAAFFFGLDRITQNSWGLLLTEGQNPELVVRCYSLAQFMGPLSAFFAPLGKLAVDRYGLVPTVRVLYLIAAVMMTLKFVLLYFLSHETDMGRLRMQQTKHQSVFQLTWGCKDVFLAMLKEKKMLLAIGVLSAYQCVSTLNANFWPLYLTDRLGVSAGNVTLFVTLKSAIVLACVLLIGPRLHFERFKRPMLLSWGLFALSQCLLLLTPVAGGTAAIVLSVALEAAAISVISPMSESLLFIHADPQERARVMGLVFAAMLVPVSAVPAVAGFFADKNIAAPIAINLIILALGALLTYRLWRVRREEIA